MISIVLIGPESSGKTVLSEYLADHFETIWVEEYLREHFNQFSSVLEEKMLEIAQKQRKNEEKGEETAENIVFFDTNLVTLKVYHELYFDSLAFWFRELYHRKNYTHYLLLKPDIPWVDDGQRDMKDHRDAIFSLFESQLLMLECPFSVVSGDFDQRKAMAVELVNEIIQSVG